MDVLGYLVRLRGAGEAAAQMRGLAAETKAATGEMTTMGKAGSAGIALAGKAILGIGAAAVGVGLEAVKMSTAFNHEMLRIRTETGGTTQELANMKTAVLDMAASGASMGQGPMSLAQGLYHLESLGLRGKDAMHALTLSAQEAAISGASLEQTTSALGAAMFVGIKGAGGLDNIMALLNATVGSGNMRFGQLIESLGTGVLASFKVAHMSIQDVSAALAVLTDSGYQASSGAAQLSTALHFLYAPSSKAETALRNIGLSGRQLGLDLMKPQGLNKALVDLHSHMKNLSAIDQEQILGSILPGGRGRVLLTLYESLNRLHGKYGQQKSILGEFQTGVAAQRLDPQTQLKMGEARIQADMIRLGNMLTPFVIPALAFLLNTGSKFLEWLLKMPQAISAVVTWFKGLGSTGGDVGKTVGGAFDSIGNTASRLWRDLGTIFNGIIDAAKRTFNGEFFNDLQIIGSKIVWFGGKVFGVFGDIIHMLLPNLIAGFRDGFQVIRGIVEFFAGLFTGNFSKMWSGIKDMFSGAIKGVINILDEGVKLIWNVGFNIGWTLIKAIAQGMLAAPGLITQAIQSVVPKPLQGVLGGILGGLDPIAPVVGLVNSVTGGGSSTAKAPAGSAHAAPVGGRGHVQGLTPGAAWRHGDIVLKVGPDELARVHRKQILNAMAAGA